MKRKNKLNSWQEKIIPLVVALIFISPVFFFKGPRLAYIILVGAIGFFVGKEAIHKINNPEEKNCSFIFTIIYIVLFCFIYLNFSNAFFMQGNHLTYLTVLIFGSWTFYVGLEGMRTKEIVIRGFLFSRAGAIFFSIASLIASLALLLLPVIK